MFFHLFQQGGAVEVEELGRPAFHPVALAQGLEDQIPFEGLDRIGKQDALLRKFRRLPVGARMRR